MLPQVLRHLFNVAPVHDFIGRFPVRVCTSYQVGMGNHADAADISVLETADRGLPCLYEHFLIIIQFPFLSAVLLQDDQVTAHFRACVVREKIVRQACDTHRIGMFHHILAYGRVGRGIQHPLRGDERHNAALAHRVEALQKEIVVYRLRGGTPCRVVAARKLRVEHRHITERNVGDDKVEVVGKRLFYLLESLHPHFLIGMQVFQNPARHQVFFKCHYIGIRLVAQHRIHECAHACRGFKHTVGAYAVPVQHIGNRIGYLRRGVEGGQYGLLHRVHVPLVFHFVTAVLPHQSVQLHRRGKQFEV